MLIVDPDGWKCNFLSMSDQELADVLIVRKRVWKWVLPVSAAVLSAVGGLLFGYDTGVISGAMIQIRHQFSLSYLYQEVIISITLAAAAIAALVSGSMTDSLGRKPVILLASAIFTIGAVVLGVAKTKETLLIGRLIVGLGIGMASMTVPVYIAEIAPTHLRGRLVTLNTVCITGGQFLAGIVDGLFIMDSVNGWRYMLALGGVPSLIQMIGFLAMPETPRWLVQKGRIEEAREVLRRTHGELEVTPDIENELQSIVKAASMVSQSNTDAQTNPSTYQPLNEKRLSDSSTSDSISNFSSVDGISLSTHPTLLTAQSNSRGIKAWLGNLTVAHVLRNPATRRSFFVSCALQMFQQLVGINTVMYYSASIISMAGIASNSNPKYRDSTVVWMSAVVAFANFAFCAVSLWLVSCFRRRTLLLSSLSGVLCSLVFLGISFQLIASYSSPVTVVEEMYSAPSYPTTRNDCSSARTCDDCMRTALCGFCYSVSPSDSMTVVNGSCVSSTGEYSEHSTYGRCSNITMDSTQFVWAYDHCPTRLGWLTLVGLLLYLASFAPGMAPIPWTVISEMFPTWARSTGMAGGAASNWVANIVVSLTFLTLTDVMTRQGTYFMYAGITVLALIFVYKCVPETGDLALEDISTDLTTPVHTESA